MHAGPKSGNFVGMTTTYTTTTTPTTTTIPLPMNSQTDVPVRWYDTAPEFRRIPGGWADVPAGWYADHRDPVVAAAAYVWRQNGLTYQEVADRCQIQTFRMAEQIVARYARQWGAPVRRAYRRTRRTPAPRRYGIEVEFHGQGWMRQHIVDSLNRNGIPAAVESYNHDVRPHWKMTTDATVTGGECVSPIMDGTPESIEQVLEVVRTVKAAGGTTGRRVGMHVHHDVNDYTQEDMVRLVTTLRSMQRALCLYVPAHRYDGSNTYGARMIRDYEWNALEQAVTNGSLIPAAVRTRAARVGACPVSRYSAVNWNSVLTYGTVEIRLLGNTLNTRKIRVWLEVTTAIFRAVKDGHEAADHMTPETMTDWLVQNGGLSRDTATAYVAECDRRAGR